MATRGWQGVTLTDLRGNALRVPSKYRNQVVEYEGQRFHSKRELAYWLGLQARQQNGEITNLRRQEAFGIWGVRPDGSKEYVCEYVADFEIGRASCRERVELLVVGGG